MATRILLADEYEKVRQELHTILEQEPDFTVVAEVDTGQAAVRVAPEVEPDVVILSLAMTRLKGLDPVHQLTAAVPSAKVIILSMQADRKFVLAVLQAGASGYVLKENAVEELAVAIRAVRAQKTYVSHSLFSLVIQDYLDLLRASEARFRTIFEVSSIGIALVDIESRIVDSNPALQVLVGYSKDELSHKVFTEFIKPEEAAKCRNLFKDLVAGNRGPYRMGIEYRRQDGRLSWGRLMVTPFRRASQVAIVMFEDISDQKQTEAKIHKYQEKLRSLSQEISLTDEEERRRLATGFHDDVGQLLALVQIQLGLVRRSVPDDQTVSLDQIRELLGQIIRSARSLIGELSPPVLYELGFESAIEWLAEKIQEQYGIQITVSADQSPKPLSEEVQVFLFHLMRELLGNIVRRAKPGKVTVLIRRTDSKMELTIENDWDTESPLPSPDDLWLFSIRERLRYLGGSLEVQFGPGRSTRMSLVLPLEERPVRAKLESRDQERTTELTKADESLVKESSQHSLTEKTLQEIEGRYYYTGELSPETTQQELFRQRSEDLSRVRRLVEALAVPLTWEQLFQGLLNAVWESLDLKILGLEFQEDGKELTLEVYRRHPELQEEAVANFKAWLKQHVHQLSQAGTGISEVSTPERPFSQILIAKVRAGESLALVAGGRDTPFTQEESELFRVIMLQGEAALKNLELFEEAKSLAIRDGLTGLYNYRHFRELLVHEVELSRRYKSPLSLLFLDLDHFKAINDTLGHSQGDVVLKTLANYLQGALRHSDVICRYGGEEFLALLPKTPLDQAMMLAERLRQKIAQIAIPLPKRELRFTVSIGVAGLTTEMDPDALVDAADTAMYQAKRAGRNRVFGPEPLGME